MRLDMAHGTVQLWTVLLTVLNIHVLLPLVGSLVLLVCYLVHPYVEFRSKQITLARKTKKKLVPRRVHTVTVQ